MILQPAPFHDPSDEFYLLSHIIINIIFLIGLTLSVRRYKKKKSINNLILVFLTLQGLLMSFANYLAYIIAWDRIMPVIGSFGVFFFIFSLIVLNTRLEKKVEERTKEAEESEKKNRNLVMNIVDVIIELNKDLIITYITPQVKSLLNFKPYEMLNHKFLDFVSEDEVSMVDAAFKSSIKTSESILIECKLETKAGKYVDVAIRGTLVKEDKDMKIIGVIRDMTDQKKAEIILKEQFEKLKEIDQIRSDLVRRTSHELKTPLISLFSSTQYLLDTYKDEMSSEILKFIKIINRGGKRLKQLTDNLLDAYNIESKGLKLKIEKVDITKSIKDCANDLIFSLEERDLYLKEEFEEKFYIDVDKARIEQVILNLLSNAIKNTPSKGIILIKLEYNKDYADIIIKDTGIGLTDDEKEQLFEKFGKIERVNIDIKLDTQGSGLGLYISKEIVEKHGGKIMVESEGRNKGSTFIIRLPFINYN